MTPTQQAAQAAILAAHAEPVYKPPTEKDLAARRIDLAKWKREEIERGRQVDPAKKARQLRFITGVGRPKRLGGGGI